MRATGFAREDVLGRAAGETVIPPEERAAFEELIAYLWKTGFSSPRLGHWLTRDGGRRLIVVVQPAADGRRRARRCAS